MISTTLSLFLLCNPVPVECVMSDSTKPFRCFMDAIIADQMRRGVTRNNVLNISAMDEYDPVHFRREAQQRDQGEADYDGDMGREQADIDRDNGRHGAGFVAPAWQQLATALPEIAAPSIVPDQPDTQADTTIAYLHKREASE